jgi:hypothetical protein
MPRLVGHRPGDQEQLLREVIEALPLFLDITTNSAAGDETKVEHNLGRVPNGYAIVKQPPGRVFTHGHDSAGTPWDKQFMYIIFNVEGLDLTLAVF